jgi:hypothetical protein
MAAWGDEVAQHLEAKIRDAVERMIGDIESTISDVREAIDQQLDAAMQSVQADTKGMSIGAILNQALADLSPPAAPEPPPPPPVADASRVRDAMSVIEQGRSQVDVLNALLEQCRVFGSRAALLILKGDVFSGWKGSGFSAHGGNDEQVKRFSAGPGMVPELDRLLREERVAVWDGASFAARLGVTAPSKAIVVPMVIKDKVSAAMYVDAFPDHEDTFDQAAIELLVFATGLMIDTLAIRKKTPSPSLTPNVAAGQPAAQPVATAPAAAPPAPAPAPVVAAPPPAPVVAAPPPPAPPPPAPVAAPAPPPSPVRSVTDMSLDNIPVPTPSRPAAPPPPVSAPVAPPPARPAAPAGEEVERPSTQFIPPAGLKGGGAAAQPQSEAARKHDEARRFARLLVSEIKLYNEAKVEQGRKNKDLYERLKEDIDRSRQMYDERIPDEVRKQSNYFYDELVRILADGDAASLGL